MCKMYKLQSYVAIVALLTASCDAQVGAVNAQVGAVNAQVGAVNAQVGAVNAQVGAVNAQLGAVNLFNVHREARDSFSGEAGPILGGQSLEDVERRSENAQNPVSCNYNGKIYAAGEAFQPTPCEHCTCTGSGKPICAIVDCAFTSCVDAVRDPDQCCPVCPNGPNCQHPDGTVIQAGEEYRPDSNTVCMCPEASYSPDATRARCIPAGRWFLRARPMPRGYHDGMLR